MTLINKINKKIKNLNDLKEELKQFQEEKNNFIAKINREIKENSNKIPSISFDTQIEKIEILTANYHDEKRAKEQENDDIKRSFREKGISGDITTLLEQTTRYQEEINELKEKLRIIEEKESTLEDKFKQIKNIINEVNDSNNNFKNDVENSWANLKKGKEDWTEEQKELINTLLKDIEIEIIEEFNEEIFYEKIKDTLNLNKFRETVNKSQAERIKEFFNIVSKDEFIRLLKDEMIINFDDNQKKLSEIIDSDIFVKDGAKNFLKILLLNYHDFWKVITKPKYKNKELHQSSVGMKGTMYLCLKLATDPFMKPFIFDQPEDDLDNNFIVNELVPIFKKIKKYRQVIIVTHNANLVVNADAEQVIIAQNNDEVISYESGSIENPKIRDKICEILEGGENAFKNRERKYFVK